MNHKIIKIINGFFFYLIWIGCIAGVRLNLFYLGPAITIFFIAVHLMVVEQVKREIELIFFCLLLGGIVEGLFIYFGVLTYKGYFLLSSALPPIWILCIWITLSLTINYSMAFLKGRFYLTILGGLIFGPWCYYVAMKSEVLYFHFPILQTILILGLSWGACLPIMYYINKKIGSRDGV